MGWLRRFLYGRYGGDALNLTLLIFGVLWSIVWRLAPLWYLGYLSYLTLGWAIYRMLSRNIYKRRAENEWFLNKTRPISRRFGGWYRRAKDTAHRYFACPTCKQSCRVPRGRGRIEISCPKCGTKFVRKA